MKDAIDMVMKAYNKKTIIFIHHAESLGGASNSLLEMLRKIDKNKYKILVVLPEQGPFSDLLQENNIEYKIIPLFIFYYCPQAKNFSWRNFQTVLFSIKKLFNLPINFLGNVFCLLRILKKENPHIVVVNSSTLLLSGLIARLMKKPVFWHIREVISTEKSVFFKRLIAGIINYSSEKVIVHSKYSFNDMVNLGVKNVALVYNSVDLGRFFKKDRYNEEFVKIGLKPEDKVVGFVGQIYKEKGWSILIKTAFILRQKLPNIKFIIVGSSYMNQRGRDKYNDLLKNYREDRLFRQAVKDMDLENNFIFLGQRYDIENILPLMDCLVFPVIAPETFGRVMIEAMASSVAVVASDIGASREIVVNNMTGLLVKPNDPHNLSEALIEILTGDFKAKNMGNAGRRRVEEIFDAEKNILAIFQLYGL